MAAPESGHAVSSDPEKEATRAQLARILASPDFNVPARLQAFLTYVVEEALAGRADRIKAYTIATNVFGRDESFDLHNDPVVRIEAGRLRRALERYYLTAGIADALVIQIPKGGYVPSFERRVQTTTAEPPSDREGFGGMAQPRAQTEALLRWEQIRLVVIGAAIALVMASAAAYGLMHYGEFEGGAEQGVAPAGPSLVVRPFANLSGDQNAALYADGLTEELITQLARFRELKVFGRETSRSLTSSQSTAEIGNQLGVGYLLEGSVRIADQHLRVNSRLLDGATAEIIWAQSYEKDLAASGTSGIEDDIASQVATAVAQPYGAIFKSAPRNANSRMPENLSAHQCVMRFYSYRRLLNQQAHAPARDCMESVTARFPDFSTGWAMLAYLYLDEIRFDLNRRTSSPSAMVRAREAAARAVLLDPTNVRSLQAQMTVLFFDREPGPALALGEHALFLNPNDTELLAEVGSRIAQAGDWKRGGAMLERALARNPAHTGLYMGLLAQAAYMEGDDARATELIRRADLESFSIYHFVAALIFARAGLEAEAERSRAAFMRMRPGFFQRFENELAMRNFNARDRAILTQGARQARFPVPATTSRQGT